MPLFHGLLTAQSPGAPVRVGDAPCLRVSPQALSYTGSHEQVHAPSLVEEEVLREDGSVVKRFGLARVLPAN